jgi:hypothetical protein
MAHPERIPSIYDDIDLVEFPSIGDAQNFVVVVGRTAGENEEVDGYVVGPLIDEEGFVSWGVSVNVYRKYPQEVLDVI